MALRTFTRPSPLLASTALDSRNNHVERHHPQAASGFPANTGMFHGAITTSILSGPYAFNQTARRRGLWDLGDGHRPFHVSSRRLAGGGDIKPQRARRNLVAGRSHLNGRRETEVSGQELSTADRDFRHLSGSLAQSTPAACLPKNARCRDATTTDDREEAKCAALRADDSHRGHTPHAFESREDPGPALMVGAWRPTLHSRDAHLLVGADAGLRSGTLSNAISRMRFGHTST